ncbi:hypothetical protein Q4Q34_17220 [Flavivirga abyssicola]|uniref:hypothetical protein n=1 Tax=Flavivirga abyssicola TaxID=3063533 RepID=UPI0026DED4ED|nr:hypothetical protein [Flavivirga sp. MEBiC07777]WVK12956.1 hypothetical protein Q4Q34_17220 [Flavivirga sp. MEBiC07777]
MDNKRQKLIKGKSQNSQRPDNKSLVIGSIVATLIAIIPYLFYLYESVPSVKVWDTFLFTYNSGYFEDANIAMWILTGKIIPLYILFIWFFTCRHWWYHVLLVPISMYTYQIFVSLNEDLKYFDSNQLIYLIPIMAIIVPSIYLIRAQIFNKINEANKSLEELEDEFKISPKNFWGKVKEYF